MIAVQQHGQSLIASGVSAAFIPCLFGLLIALNSDRWRQIRDRHRATR